MNEMIKVESTKDFPIGAVIGKRAKSVEEIRTWAEQRQASQVWYYLHKIGHEVYTAVVMMAEAP